MPLNTNWDHVLHGAPRDSLPRRSVVIASAIPVDRKSFWDVGPVLWGCVVGGQLRLIGHWGYLEFVPDGEEKGMCEEMEDS